MDDAKVSPFPSLPSPPDGSVDVHPIGQGPSGALMIRSPVPDRRTALSQAPRPSSDRPPTLVATPPPNQRTDFYNHVQPPRSETRVGLDQSRPLLGTPPSDLTRPPLQSSTMIEHNTATQQERFQAGNRNQRRNIEIMSVSRSQSQTVTQLASRAQNYNNDGTTHNPTIPQLATSYTDMLSNTMTSASTIDFSAVLSDLLGPQPSYTQPINESESSGSLFIDEQFLSMDFDDFINAAEVDLNSGPLAPHAYIPLNVESDAPSSPVSTVSPTVFELGPQGFPSLAALPVPPQPQLFVGHASFNLPPMPLLLPSFRDFTPSEPYDHVPQVEALVSLSDLETTQPQVDAPAAAQPSEPAPSSRPVRSRPKAEPKRREKGPLDAPPQPKVYLGPSSTSLTALPAHFVSRVPEHLKEGVKRALTAGPSSSSATKRAKRSPGPEPSAEARQLAEQLAPAIMTKREQNRMAARRSRARKDQRVEELQEEAEAHKRRADEAERLLEKAREEIEALKAMLRPT